MTLLPSWRRLSAVAATGLLVLGFAAYIARNTGNPLDFHTFYYAATAESHGADPYRIESLWAAAGKGVELPYLYPPVTLALFVPFTLLPMSTAALLWLGLKLVLLAALVVVWRRWFLRDTSLALIVGVTILGFNGAALWDLANGNVAVVEQFVLWTAFACYVAERRGPFALLVATAAVFKLLPIAFLGLLLVPSRRHGRSFGWLLAGLALFAALVFLPWALDLDWAHGFLPAAPAQRPLGETNPCVLGMLDTWMGPVRWSGDGWSSGAGARTLTSGALDPAVLLWGIYCAVVLVTSRALIRRVRSSRDATFSVVVASLAFALLAPRMMVYSYLGLVVPALLVVRDSFGSRKGRAAAIVLIVIQGVYLFARGFAPARIPAPPYLVSVLAMNLSFFIAYGLWLALGRSPGTASTPGSRSRTSTAG